MKIAVTTEGKEVFQHFGNCKEFTIFEIEDQKIVHTSKLDTSESGHGALAKLMQESKVDVLICGGIGGGAKNALRINHIEIIAGVKGTVEEAVVKYLSGEVVGDPDFVCNHNGHDDGKGHTCHCS